MKKYKKYNRHSLLNPYILFIIIIFTVIAMSIGYASFTEQISIFGTANAKYTIYEINYILNGGENPENAINSYKEIDKIPLPIPIRSNYVFDGWYLNENCTGTRIITTDGLKENITLYAKWKNEITYSEQYSYSGEYVFNGNNYIDTNIYLYSQENIHRNFIISFDIVSVDESNVNHNALMNSMNESGSPWSGHVVKVSGSGTSKRLKFESNSNTSSTGDTYISDSVKNIRIIRISDQLYCSFDNETCIKLNNYTGFTNTFDVPVTFGASIDGNMKPFRYFKGTLANMSISFLDDDVVIDDFNPINQLEFEIRYEYKGTLELNGVDNYIDTGLCLFSQENFYKDFEISLNIDSVEEGNASQATILNVKNEQITSYPAFVYRIYPLTDKTIRFESKGGKGSGASNKISEVKKVKISRRNSKMYLSINDKEEKEVYDFTGFTNFFSVPLTFGSSLDSKGKPFRFFKGTLSNIVVKVQK